jgi:hypothetical protein
MELAVEERGLPATFGPAARASVPGPGKMPASPVMLRPVPRRATDRRAPSMPGCRTGFDLRGAVGRLGPDQGEA